MPDARSLRRICRDLVARHGAAGWWPSSGCFEVMVGAVLVQNTRWANVERAIANLRRHDALCPAALAEAPVSQIAEWIRSAGCQGVKGQRLSALARWVVASGGIARLRRQPLRALRAGLLQVHGVGPETADAILCFAFDRPVFIADRYARRWLARLGQIGVVAERDYEVCRAAIESSLDWPATQLQILHGAIVQFAQSVCRRSPACGECFLRQRCRYPTQR